MFHGSILRRYSRYNILPRKFHILEERNSHGARSLNVRGNYLQFPLFFPRRNLQLRRKIHFQFPRQLRNRTNKSLLAARTYIHSHIAIYVYALRAISLPLQCVCTRNESSKKASPHNTTHLRIDIYTRAYTVQWNIMDNVCASNRFLPGYCLRLFLFRAAIKRRERVVPRFLLLSTGIWSVRIDSVIDTSTAIIDAIRVFHNFL